MKSLIPCSLLLALALGICGCRTAPTLSSPDHAPGVIVVEERSSDFYHGRPRRIPPDAYRPRVDYKSELRIAVDTNRLLREVTTPKDVLARLTPEQKDGLDQLGGFVQAARQYLAARLDSIRFYDQKKNQTLNLDDPRLRELVQAEARAATNLLDRLLTYAKAKVREENPALTGGNLIRARDALILPFVPLANNQAMSVNIYKLSDFVAAESAALVRQVSQDAQLVTNTGAFLRMRATIWPAGTPLHILNYDTFSDANVIQEERVSFTMSEEDRQRLAAETKVNGDVAQLIRDAQNSTSDVRQSLDALVTAMRGDMKDWKEAVTNLTGLAQEITTVIAALGKAGGSTKLGEAQQKVVNDAKRILSDAKNDVQLFRDTLNRFVGNSNPETDPADALLMAVDELSQGLDTVHKAPPTIAANINAAFADLQKLLGEIEGAVRDDPANLQDFANALKAGAPASADEVNKLLDVCMRNYPNLVAEFRSLRSKTQVAAMASKLAPIQTDPNLLDTDLISLPEGYISLAKNVARGGVIVELNAALVKRNGGTAPATVKAVGHQEFQVEKLGVVNSWSANLILVKRLGDLDPGEHKAQFSPAPSISWTLHYNPPPSADAEVQPRNKFWNTIYPGLGLNVAALNWDNGVQFGMGAHLSLFKNLLSVGAGWNLNESRHGGYMFVGLGLFETLNKLGLIGDSFPLGQ